MCCHSYYSKHLDLSHLDMVFLSFLKQHKSKLKKIRQNYSRQQNFTLSTSPFSPQLSYQMFYSHRITTISVRNGYQRSSGPLQKLSPAAKLHQLQYQTKLLKVTSNLASSFTKEGNLTSMGKLI